MSSQDMYFVITCNEGGMHIEGLAVELLMLRLNKRYYGGDRRRPVFLKNLGDVRDGHLPMCDDITTIPMLVIKGQIIEPKPVLKVTEWQVP